MSLGLRRASPTADREEMLCVLKRNFGPIQEERFDWRHVHNPAGECWSWFLYDRNTLVTVAMATVFPRNMRIDGKSVRGGQVGEFAVDAAHRSLGPAVLLQRTTFEPVDTGCLDICYDCPPHDKGMSTFARLGMRPNCEVFRYALPLKSDEYFIRRFGKHFWTGPAVAAGNLFLGLPRWKHKRPGLEICKHDGPFEEEFSRLDALAWTRGKVRSSRAAVDMNWRYVDDPLASLCSHAGITGRYRVLVARRQGELVGFVIYFMQSDSVAAVVDLFGVDMRDSGRALLEAVIDSCRREKVSSLHGFCSEGTELNALFSSAGFRRRERNSRVVAYARRNASSPGLLSPGLQWAFGQVEVML